MLPLKIRDKLLPKIDTSFDSKTRARTRNQYTQQLLYPSPSSPFVTGPTEPLQIRRRVASLHLGPREVESGGAITELKILLLRDAAVYGPIAHRLIYGMFPPMEGKRRKAEEECIWLGMEGLAEETAARLKGQKSMVLKGGEGYI